MKLHNSQNTLNSSKENNLFQSRYFQSSEIKNKSKSNCKNFDKNFLQHSTCSRIIIKDKHFHESENLCFEDCSNYNLIKQYEQNIKELLESNLNLKNINEYLIKTLNLKDDMIIDVTNKNKDLKLDNNILNKHIGSKRILSSRQCQIKNPTRDSFPLDYNDNKKNLILSDQEIPKLNFSKNKNIKNIFNISKNKVIDTTNINFIENRINEFKKESIKKEIQEDEVTNSLNIKKLKNNHNDATIKKSIFSSNNNHAVKMFQSNFYDKLSNMFLKNNNFKSKNKGRSSLLVLKDEMLEKITTNDIVSNLKRLSSNDEKFIEFFRLNSDDILVNYCDAISSLISDLESALKLIQKMRNYITITSNMRNFTLKDEVTSVIIKDSCKILDCDRTSIFMYDNLSDMLVVHTGEGLVKNEIRINKNKGIIGNVFTKGELIRVDDAYSDSRFSKEQDKKSNYVTNTILAAPLKDSEGEIFGAIQSINKKNGKFTSDDEELIHLFSLHVGQIMKNAKCNDENVSYIARLKMVISFRNELEKIINLIDFSNAVENILTSIFSTQNSQLLFNNPNKNNLTRITKYERTEKNKNIGIIGYVFEKKEYFGTNSANSCQFYNNLVDIETGMSLLTFPIIIERNVIAIIQFSYNDNLLHFKKIKESDEQVIDYLIKDCEKWLILNKEILENTLS